VRPKAPLADILEHGQGLLPTTPSTARTESKDDLFDSCY